MKSIYVVYNPSSGSSLSASELRTKCAAADLRVIRLIALSDDLDSALRSPIRNKAIVAVVGGDGTINAVAKKLVGTGATLAPLPGGTLNHFTKDAGIPQEIDSALKRIASGRSRLVDVGMVNDIVFLNNSSIGIYPRSLSTRERLEDSIGKWPAAAVGVIRAFIKFRTYRLSINGKSVVSPFLFVGNNPYNLDDFGGTNRTKLDAGVMSIYMTRAHTRLQLAKLFVFAASGRLHDADELVAYETKHKLEIASSHSHIQVAHDGEVTRLKSPIIYQIQPKRLRII